MEREGRIYKDHQVGGEAEDRPADYLVPMLDVFCYLKYTFHSLFLPF